MSVNRETPLCRYHYDPLDRLANCSPSTQASTQRFYLQKRLTCELQGSIGRSIFQQADQLLAQQQRQNGAVETTLLTTDQQRSVLHALNATQPCALVYTPYGHRPPENDLLSLLGFNGERPDLVTGHYLLGNGYRAFNPMLMRFNSPDSFSPFGAGGLNAYVYCIGDPVNSTDPSGHYISFSSLWKAFLNFLRPRTPNSPSPATSFQATTVNAANSASRIVNSGSMASASSKPLRGPIPTPAPQKMPHRPASKTQSVLGLLAVLCQSRDFQKLDRYHHCLPMHDCTLIGRSLGLQNGLQIFITHPALWPLKHLLQRVKICIYLFRLSASHPWKQYLSHQKTFGFGNKRPGKLLKEEKEFDTTGK
ncbi:MULTISPECIES: RHS repeat-associated core domain-containing protein [Pseudomonas]|uniref:Rhs family protein n=1 Tax=Pseudomonas fluorescens (strain Q2-87) TaxID=1038922 RepID=J2XWB5_PSEFQ|nr:MULTISPECIES: RHS repeat-associated core domain-containing protein [Pseudomonas]EJK99045.1 Rhs family protein [Pseudomonas fluorescens Q2-87]